VVGACAALLALPGPMPRGEVLDLVGDAAAGPDAAAGQEPGPTTTAVPVASPKTVPDARQVPSPAPTTTPPPAIGGNPIGPGASHARRFLAPKAPPIDTLEGYVWPIKHPRLTLPFGPTVWGSRLVNGERFHDGVDLATFCGDRVVAAHRGRVIAAGRHFDAAMGWVGDLGPYLARLDKKHLWSTLPIVVVIDDGNGYRSVYAHFGRVVVKKGQVVKAGQLLGYEGATGRASGCHLHYGLFSPWERATFAIRPDVVKRMKVPKAEIARIDPLLVLPPKAGINAPPAPKATPTPKATPMPQP
jgi:murein DD-endopeptidase MepM/ murein hydrolase activator NlpD